MIKKIDAPSLKAMLKDGQEIAVLDVREEGQFGEGHLLFAVPAPYSILEARIDALVPRRDTRIILIDDADGVAERAADRLTAVGYSDITCLDGGITAWADSSYELFKGVNVPSKAFGEMVELHVHTPSISAEELHVMLEANEDCVVLDGRTYEEYHRMNIPRAISVPNAELVYRIHDIVSSSETTVVVNCAGRTRSIIGAQTLINAGLPNRVFALRDGTMGWILAGYELEHGSTRCYPDVSKEGMEKAKKCAKVMTTQYGVQRVDQKTLEKWQADSNRTLYLFDVRSRGEYEAGHLPGAIHAPGGQLVQKTDSWIGIWGARIILTDDTEIRAITTGHWLKQMGWEVYVFSDENRNMMTEIGEPSREFLGKYELDVETISPYLLKNAINEGVITVIDVDNSMDYRKHHLPGALWGIRPRLNRLISKLSKCNQIVLYSEHETRARLATHDIRILTDVPVMVLEGGREAWIASGFPTESSPETPMDMDSIDFLFFAHERRHGNKAAMLEYLSWEVSLPMKIVRDGDSRYNIL
jgi:rhodanese-related sulfurtransferase